MSIEEILLSAEDHGKRTEIFSVIEQLKQSHPSLRMEELYEKAYEIVMKI